MVVVAQLVRASVCGTESRGFEPHLPPRIKKAFSFEKAFLLLGVFLGVLGVRGQLRVFNKKAYQILKVLFNNMMFR